MSEKIKEFIIDINHSVEFYKDHDGDGYCTSCRGEVDQNKLKNNIVETLKTALEVIVEESTEEQKVDFTKEEIEGLIENIDIKIKSDITSEPVERDVFSPSLGHGTVTDSYRSTENIVINLEIKDVNLNKLKKEDFDVFMEDFKEDFDGLFNDPEFEEEVKVVDKMSLSPKKKKIKP